ncbi:MAG: DUF2760 domain-containing protein [Verrucomicrobia bacterium]|nr:DUF2760 domain-containing protein [Verrucomicrobiota bacterium]MCH8527356.1 DUF2760 domain-containing protein [Kiritimatiellia bacterium]
MKTAFFVLLAAVLAVLNGLDYAVSLPFSAWMPLLNAGGIAVLAVFGALGMRGAGSGTEPETGTAPPQPISAPVLPPVVSRDERAKHELAAFLGMLQEKGRLVDFVMEDLNAQPDARVGQVARVVHQGCREVILKAFSPEPVESGVAEGDPLSLEAGYAPEAYRLIGTAAEGAPRGRLVHRGWRAKAVNLPEFSKEPREDASGYVIAPAELELG